MFSLITLPPPRTYFFFFFLAKSHVMLKITAYSLRNITPCSGARRNLSCCEVSLPLPGIPGCCAKWLSLIEPATVPLGKELPEQLRNVSCLLLPLCSQEPFQHLHSSAGLSGWRPQPQRGVFIGAPKVIWVRGFAHLNIWNWKGNFHFRKHLFF